MVFTIIFWVALGLAAVSLILAVVLFLRDKIWLVIADLSGKTAQRSIEQIRAETAGGKRKYYSGGHRRVDYANVQGARGEANADASTVPLQSNKTAPMPDGNDSNRTTLLKKRGARKGTAVLRPQTAGGTAVLQDDAPLSGATEAMGGATEEMSGTVMLTDPPAGGGTMPLSNAPEQGAVQLDGTVALHEHAPSFRIVERVVLTFTDEVIA